MSNSSGMGLAFVAAGAIASMPASAGPVTVTHAVTLNTLMQQGNSSTLQFDLNNFLSSEGYSAGEVVGGTVSVFGFSEASYGAPQYGSSYNTNTYVSGYHNGYYAYYVQGYRSCGWWSCYYSGGYTAWAAYSIADYTQLSDRDVTHVDAVADQMRVSLGTSTATGTADTIAYSSSPPGQYIYDGTTPCYGSNCSYTTMYHRDRDIYSAVYGTLETTQALDIGALLDLNTDGILGVGVAAPVGQFNLGSISFDLVVQHAQAVARNGLGASDVPEPAGLALTGLALAAALAAGRYRRRAA